MKRGRITTGRGHCLRVVPAAAALLAVAVGAPASAGTRPREAYSGGATTVFAGGQNAFSLPLANVQRETRRKFSVGNSFFRENWVIAPATAQARDGLGPLFHARSCSSCHIMDGRGAPPDTGETMTGLLLRLSLPGTGPNGGPLPDPVYGDQLAVRAIPGAEPEAVVPVRWIESSVELAGGETVSLRRPEVGPVEWKYGPPGDGIRIGPRLAPGVYGLGLLEAIPEDAIRALADSDDRDGDGISGRVNEVWSRETGTTRMGRFGWKANQPTLRQQAAEAFAGDIGLTTSLVPEGNLTPAQRETAAGKLPDGGSPEISDLILDRVTTYLQALAPPGRRNTEAPEVIRGEAIFRSLRCDACHVAEWRTGPDAPLAELRDQTIRPFTDLLLHDMGPDLDDGRPDFLASGTEWRTPPLWGLGLNKAVNSNTFYLHDGRARTPAEAILWHGGEAAASRDGFRSLPPAERADLLAFLNSL